MMEMEQTTGSCPAPSQTAVRTFIFSSTRGAPSVTTSRFTGDGVRYKAKLIGVDPVPDAQGDKMCWDSMMKLKGFEAAARRQGRHKKRVWLKVSSSGLKIVDERTGAVIYDHDRSRISSWRKDESDPRALAYIHQHQDTYNLFYIKTAGLADPVLVDILEVCQDVHQGAPQEPAVAPQQPAEPPAQSSSLLLISGSAAPAAEGSALESVFSPRPDSSAGQSNQASSRSELMEVFSIPLEDPLVPAQSSCPSQPESPQPTLSSSQILSMFPVEGSPYSSPPYSPTTMPWGQQGPLGHPWAGPAVAPWPSMPSSFPASMPGGFPAWPPASSQQIEAHHSQPGPPASPLTGNGNLAPLNSLYGPAGPTAPQQSASPTSSSNLLLL